MHNCNDEVINKILGKTSLNIEHFQANWQDQKKLREVLEEVLYNYEVQTKETSLITTDIDEKLQMFIACKRLDGISKRTLKNYYDEIKTFQNFLCKPVAIITANDVRYYLATKYRDCKETTKATKIYYLKSFFQWLFDEEYIERNIMNKIKAPKTPKRLRKALNSEETELLREACKTDRERSMLEMFICTGLRAEELTTLNISDLDFNNLTFRIIGKGNKERKLYFTAKCKILLQKYITSRQGNSIALFTSSRAPYQRLGKRAIQKEVNIIASRTNITRSVHPHLLRHGTATTLVNKNTPMPVVQSIMGHSSLATTQRYFEVNDSLVESEYRRSSL